MIGDALVLDAIRRAVAVVRGHAAHALPSAGLADRRKRILHTIKAASARGGDNAGFGAAAGSVRTLGVEEALHTVSSGDVANYRSSAALGVGLAGSPRGVGIGIAQTPRVRTTGNEEEAGKEGGGAKHEGKWGGTHVELQKK